MQFGKEKNFWIEKFINTWKQKLKKDSEVKLDNLGLKDFKPFNFNEDLYRLLVIDHGIDLGMIGKNVNGFYLLKQINEFFELDYYDCLETFQNLMLTDTNKYKLYCLSSKIQLIQFDGVAFKNNLPDTSENTSFSVHFEITK